MPKPVYKNSAQNFPARYQNFPQNITALSAKSKSSFGLFYCGGELLGHVELRMLEPASLHQLVFHLHAQQEYEMHLQHPEHRMEANMKHL